MYAYAYLVLRYLNVAEGDVGAVAGGSAVRGGQDPSVSAVVKDNYWFLY